MPGHPVSDAPRRSVALLQAQGEKVFLCTGRSSRYIPQDVQALGCDGCIFSAGGLVVAEGKELYRAYISPPMLKEILTALE